MQIIDPWGTIVATCPTYKEGGNATACISIAEVDLDVLNKVRREMPVQTHRRHDIYDLNLISTQDSVINDNKIFSFSDKKILGSTVFLKSKYSYAFTNIRCVVPGRILFWYTTNGIKKIILIFVRHLKA